MKTAKRLLLFLGIIFGVPVALHAKHPQTIEEALKCVVYIQTDKAHGSGFFLEENGTQWLYTNAHVIDGAKKISIKDYQGKAVRGFDRFQCYSLQDGGVVFDGASFGADGVRFELKNKRDYTFLLPEEPPIVLEEDSVITIGDNLGKKRMDVLKGEVEHIIEGAFQTNCETEPGSSGGVLLLEDGLIPIGLNTWGIKVSETPLQGLWQAEDKKRSVAGSTDIQGITWVTMPLVSFLKANIEAMKLKRAVMVLSIIYKLAPHEYGFTYFINDEIVPGVLMGDALELLKDDPIIEPIFKMNRRVRGRGAGNIGVNKMELARLFRDGIMLSRKSYAERMASIQKNYPPYHQLEHKTSGVLRVGEWTDSNLEKAENWFTDKIGVGGVLPVGKWYAKHTFEELEWSNVVVR